MFLYLLIIEIKKELEDYKNKNKNLNDELNSYDTEIIEVDTLKREKRNLINEIEPHSGYSAMGLFEFDR